MTPDQRVQCAKEIGRLFDAFAEAGMDVNATDAAIAEVITRHDGIDADPLFGAAEKQRADQLGRNCRWLVGQVDVIHALLCPGQTGTWQQRVEQVIAAAKERVIADARKS